MQGIILIGLQASGKSSFYSNRFLNSHIRLNMDMLKTRHREKILFNACLASKQPVVIDNTNPTKDERKEYITELKKHQFDVIGYYFSSSLHQCLERNARRTGRKCIPEIGIKGTHRKLEQPDYSEGFDQLYYVSLCKDGFNVQEWKNEI